MKNMRYVAGLLFVLVCLAPHRISSREVPSSPSLMDKVCEQALSKDLCTRALSSFPESDKANLHDLAKMALKYASINGSYVEGQVKEWLWKSTSDEFAHQCLNDCLQNYDDATEQLEDSLVALHSKSYADAQTLISAAMGEVESCGEGCNVAFPLIELNNDFSQLCSNALALVNELGA